MSDADIVAPLLTAIEARVLGCLIEKQATTPETYPLTLNAAQTACNQKSNREPLMDLEAGDVGHALRELEGKDLVRASMSARASRYEHRIDQGLAITPRQRAALCVLMLRGPQTINEIFVRCERLSDFPGADEVLVTLERLAQRTPPLVVRIPRAHGQREDRWAHLLCGPVDFAQVATSAQSASNSPAPADASTRVDELERRVDELEQTLARVLARLEGE
jgi:uncharacterized protein YceH (UPF0502 family)